MKHQTLQKLLALLLCLATVLACSGCVTKMEIGEAMPLKDGDTIGEGAVSFTLRVIDPEEKTVSVTVRTDEQMLGKALQDNHLVSGEMGSFGLYIKTVNGQTLDYDADGMYWAFYIGDEYASTSADQTKIVPGTVYTLKAEMAN